MTQDLVALRFEPGPVDPDEADVVRAAFQRKRRRLPGAERPGLADRLSSLQLRKMPDGRVIFELHRGAHLYRATASNERMPRTKTLRK